MRTIIFYGYKGGSGRTMALASVARFLAQLGQRVIALDLDLEAPDLASRLHRTTEIERGFVDLVAAYRDTGALPALDGYLVTVAPDLWKRPDGRSLGSIQVLPAGRRVGPQYWSVLTAINWQSFFVGEGPGPLDGKGTEFLLGLKAAIEETGADYLLIDSRTGVNELGATACTVLADTLVCLCTPTRENLEGTRAMLATLRGTPRPSRLLPLHLAPVLSRVPDAVLQNAASTSARARAEERLLTSVMHEIDLAVGPDVDEMVIIHSIPWLEMDDFLRECFTGDIEDAEPELLGEGRLFSEYRMLFRRLVPAELLDEHMRTLVDDAQRRAFKHPQLAQEELHAIASQYKHEHGVRSYLELCRLRDVFDDDALELARDLVDVGGSVREELLRDVVCRCVERAESQVELFDADVLHFAAKVWLAHADAPGSVGLRLLQSMPASPDDGVLITQLIDGLATRVARGDAEVAIGLAHYFTDMGDGGRAAEMLQRLPGVRTQPVQRAWARAVVSLQQRADAIALLQNPSFDETSVRGDARLWIELHRIAGCLDEALRQMPDPRRADNALRPGSSQQREVNEILALVGRVEDKSPASRYFRARAAEVVRLGGQGDLIIPSDE